MLPLEQVLKSRTPILMENERAERLSRLLCERIGVKITHTDPVYKPVPSLNGKCAWKAKYSILIEVWMYM